MFCRQLSCAGLNHPLESVQTLRALIQVTPWIPLLLPGGSLKAQLSNNSTQTKKETNTNNKIKHGSITKIFLDLFQ